MRRRGKSSSRLPRFFRECWPRVVLVGLDEETVEVLLEKLLATDKVKVESLVYGFTWWKRILEKSENQCE